MMFLHPEHERTYARLAGLLRRIGAASDRALEIALEMYSGLDNGEVLTALQWGVKPYLDVVNNLPSRHENALACTHRLRPPKSKTTIYLAQFVVDELETPSVLSEADITLLVESIVFHELVHWGRFEKGLDERVNGQEAGKLFEWEYYGRDITWHAGQRRLSYYPRGTQY
jgi:hypothetical protein